MIRIRVGIRVKVGITVKVRIRVRAETSISFPSVSIFMKGILLTALYLSSNVTVFTLSIHNQG